MLKSIYSFLFTPKNDGKVAIDKGRTHRFSATEDGLFEFSWRDTARGAEFKKRHDALARERDMHVRKAIDAADRAQDEANAAYDAARFKLFMEFGTLPTREKIAQANTPVGHVVHLPESAIVAATA